MSGHQSNLSDAKYGYDMVVATSQLGINLTMNHFLDHFHGQELLVCYRYDDKEKKPRPVDYQEVKRVCGVDPFSIDNIAPDPEALKKLDDFGFMFGFRAKIGIPAGVDPTKLPTVVTLDQGRDYVTYRLFFAEFCIVDLQERHHEVVWKNLVQPADNPWVLKFTVRLGQRQDDTAFKKLQDKDQALLKSINPDSAFSVQQLYLDLNYPPLQELPEITGLDKDSDAYLALQRDFINTYWEALKHKGDLTLGYAVLATHISAEAKPSLIPTALAKEVSPFHASDGQPLPAQQNFYTLNYLVMSEHSVLPPPVPFAWNWLDEKENHESHGVIAIRRERFVSVLNRVLSAALNSVSFAPQVSVWQKGLITYYSWSLPEHSGALAYVPVTDNSNGHVLTFSHKGGPVRDNAGAGGSLGWMKISANTTSEVYLSGNQIKVVTHVESHAEATALSSDTFNKKWVDVRVERWFQISVDAKGDLVVTLSTDSPAPLDHSESIALTVWGKMVSVNTADWEKGLTDTQTSAKSHLTEYAGHLTAMLNNTGAWVFPGGKTFLYKEAYFSDTLDLITHITYANPA